MIAYATQRMLNIRCKVVFNVGDEIKLGINLCDINKLNSKYEYNCIHTI